jgi:N-acetylglucosamine-6-sulfatase
VLDALSAIGIAEENVLVYSNGNGFYLGEHNARDKRSLYDDSLRVPLLARYTRMFGKGLVVDGLALTIDLAPTHLGLAGVAAPKEMQGAGAF